MLCVRTGHETSVSRFRSWSKSLFWMCLALGLCHTDLREQRQQIPDPAMVSGCRRDCLEHISAVAKMQIYCSCAASCPAKSVLYSSLICSCTGREHEIRGLAQTSGGNSFLSFVWSVSGTKTSRCALRPKRISPDVPSTFCILLSLIHRNCLKC